MLDAMENILIMYFRGADEEVSSNREDLNSTNKFYNITKPSEEGAELTHMYIYMSIIAGFIAGCLIQSVFVACMVWLAARNLYKKLQNSVMNAAMAFFERNTFGERSRMDLVFSSSFLFSYLSSELCLS